MAEQIIEHVLLLNLKEDEENEEDPDPDPYSSPCWVSQMVNTLNSLPLDHDSDLIYSTAGPILRIRSSYPDDADVDADDLNLNMSHMVHARFRSQSGLAAYSDLVDELVRPICDLVVTVDWVAEGIDGPLVAKPGSALRLTLFNLNLKNEYNDFEEAAESESESKCDDGVEDEVITELLEGLRRMSNKWRCALQSQTNPFQVEQMSYGRSQSSVKMNMSSDSEEPYKLIKVAALVVFRDLNELDACEEYEDEIRSLVHNHKIQPCLHSLIHLDYVLPRLSLPL